MTDVRSLHCPNCGAAADPQAARCPYCRARLATVSCPQCFALMFEDRRSARNAARDRPGRTRSLRRRLPRVPRRHARVTHRRVGAARVRVVRRRLGDAAEFERICADREAQAAVLHRWDTHSPAPRVPGSTTARASAAAR